MTRSSPLEAARSLAPLVEQHSAEGDAGRRLPDGLLKAFVSHRLFQLWVPESMGGHEADPVSMVEVIEEVARADGSAGWTLAVGATYGVIAGYLPEGVARLIFSAPESIVAGTLNPVGFAIAVDGGFRVSGRWPLGSGIDHCTWVLGTCKVFANDVERQDSRGRPELRVAFVPRSECTIPDTWHTGGLRGTGSHDYSVMDAFVPGERTCEAFAAEARQPGTLYACPFATMVAIPLAAVMLGISRAAIDTLRTLAGRKTAAVSGLRLRDQAITQTEFARAEALVQSARAFLIQSIRDLWDEVVSRGAATMDRRVMVRMACAMAAEQTTAAVDLMYNAGGSSSLYSAGKLDRCFRDIHAARHHIALSPANYEIAGRVLFGMEPGTARF